jgi:hypothetical protein
MPNGEYTPEQAIAGAEVVFRSYVVGKLTKLDTIVGAHLESHKAAAARPWKVAAIIMGVPSSMLALFGLTQIIAATVGG